VKKAGKDLNVMCHPMIAKCPTATDMENAIKEYATATSDGKAYFAMKVSVPIPKKHFTSLG